MPYKVGSEYNAFCAAGLAFAAASAYADLLALQSDQYNRKKIYQDLMPDLDHWYYYPSASCLDMYFVAKGKRRWREPTSANKPVPHKGWIVLYDWSKTGRADHCGVILDASQDRIHTVEFNTSGQVNGSQVDGGGVFEKYRPYNGQVKGFIMTDIVPQ
jgi:hypothetical protein